MNYSTKAECIFLPLSQVGLRANLDCLYKLIYPTNPKFTFNF